MNTAVKIILGFFAAVVSIALITMAIYIPMVVSDAKRGYRDDCEYLMVLGGNVIGADTPSEPLLERMECALNYLQENKDCFVVPCGGCFRPGQKVSEAKIIADYLVENGIDESRILLEEKSTSTVENFKFAFKIISDYSGKDINDLKIAFLSSDFHMHRAALIAKLFGLENPLRVSCPTEGDFISQCFREYIVTFTLLNPKIYK